ncbi:hypothetical protein MVEN_01195600 [Mycena venus]|uniref:F-box domain-containing protein n=1 Tax=Mycena venus TaxID=2733690 RepID=A0A8H6Y4K5_9AGAR|nr:hypothetical protein MVEN_01195600 [Mycena venus]
MALGGNLSLHDLVEDVLVLILAECDVADVVAISVTNKYFHHLALSSAVWYPLVMKLAQRGFINSGPDDENVKDLSIEQLIGLVKQMLRGPKSWTDTYSESSPAEKTVRRAANLFKKFVRKPRLASVPLLESRRILLHPMTSTGPGISHWYNKQKLLPGGKYLLFKNWIRFECWSVFEDKCIWSMGSVCVLEFNAELVEDDRIVIVACQRTWAHPPKHFAEITTLNLKTGVSNSEVVSRVPGCTWADDNTYDCAVCGDIAAVYFLWSDEVLLINWRTNSRILVLPDPSLIAMALAPGYLFLSLRHSRSRNRLAASPLASISSWEPNDSMEEPSAHIEVANLSIGVQDSIVLAGGIPCSRLWIYESPPTAGTIQGLAPYLNRLPLVALQLRVHET